MNSLPSIPERVLQRLSPQLGKVAEVMKTLMVRRGYWRTLKSERPRDGEGRAIPWMTYPALDHLSRLDFTQARVLEYGAGQSSLWWASRAREVVSVEGQAAWVEEIRQNAPSNLRLIGPVEKETYAAAALIPGEFFDVIVIDGLLRMECTKAALPYLAAGGLLIVDNSDWHPALCAYLRNEGLLQFDYHGFGPVNAYTWCTSLFVRGTSSIPYVQRPWPKAQYGNLEETAE